MLCYAMLCYAMLCYAMLYYNNLYIYIYIYMYIYIYIYIYTYIASCWGLLEFAKKVSLNFTDLNLPLQQQIRCRRRAPHDALPIKISES